MQLDRNHIRTWKDLAKAFLAQCKHVMDMVLIDYPFKTKLQGIHIEVERFGNLGVATTKR